MTVRWFHKGIYRTKLIISIYFKNVQLHTCRFFKHLFILAALGPHCCLRAFSSCGKQELLFIAMHGLLTQWCLLHSTASRRHAQQLWYMGLVARQHVASSQTRDRTHVPCIARWILSHSTTRKAPSLYVDYTYIKLSSLILNPCTITLGLWQLQNRYHFFPFLYPLPFFVASSFQPGVTHVTSTGHWGAGKHDTYRHLKSTCSGACALLEPSSIICTKPHLIRPQLDCWRMRPE